MQSVLYIAVETMKSISTPLQYACFACRKCFKRPQFTARYNRYMTSDQVAGQMQQLARQEAEREYKCPDCGGETSFMGLDFKTPKRSDARGWEAAQAFISSGKIFYRGVPQDG